MDLITEHTLTHLKKLYKADVKMRFERKFISFSIHLKKQQPEPYLLSLAKSVFPNNVCEKNTKLIGTTFNLRVNYAKS